MRQLVGALAETSQLANTLIFYVTDNGFLFGEHGLQRKSVPYLEAVKTPFAVRGPRVPAGGVSDKLVGQIDITATICDYAGARTNGFDGRSLRTLFEDEGAPWRSHLLVDHPKAGWHQLRQEEYAYVEWDTGERDLYDLHTFADPYQLQSLHADPDRAEQVGDFAAKLATLRSSGGNALRAAEEA